MSRFTLSDLDARMAGNLVVSCQTLSGGPLDDDDCVVRLAQAAEIGGAAAVRIEGARRVALAASRLSIPVIGIIKRDLDGHAVRITPLESDIDALLDAGADIIAFDATDRERPVLVAALARRIADAGCIAMADCASLAEAAYAHYCGCPIIGTTLAGYLGEVVPEEPDYDILSQFVTLPARIMAEGRYSTTEAVARAKKMGAWAVTVGTAITRIELVVEGFARALNDVAAFRNDHAATGR